MTQPLGEEFIQIRPLLAGFRAELQTQLAAALRGVVAQIPVAVSRAAAPAAAQVAAAASARATGATSVFQQLTAANPSAVFADLTAGSTQAAKAQETLSKRTQQTASELRRVGTSTRLAANESQNLARNVRTAETAVGRYSRGVVAATVASTGFFRAVSFASGAFLVGAAVGATIGAAVQEFRQMTVVGAQTAAVLKATGESANVTAGQVDALAQSQLKLTGTDDELVKQAENVLLTFRGIRNEVGAGNDVFTRSVKAVQDISSVFGTALTGSAVQLGKALQDPIRGVTALRRSGITLSQSQRDLIKNLVETGRTFTAQKIILGEVERQVGGTAEAIGQTLPGRLAILRESAKNSLGEFVKRLSESQDAAKGFSETTGGVGDAFKAIIPPITAAGKALGLSVTQAEKLGVLRPLVKTVTLLAVSFGAVKLALGVASAASALYTRATTIQTAASIAAGEAAEFEALKLGETAVAARAAGASAAASASRVGARAGAIALLTNPLVLVTAGITAATIAFVKFRGALANAPGTINATRRALEDLSNAVARNRDLTASLAGAREDVSVARFDVQAGQRTVARAQAAIQTSPAQAGSIEQIGLANRLVDAQEKLAQSNKALADAEVARDKIEGQLAENQRSRQFIITETTKGLQAQIAALARAKVPTIFGTFRTGLFGGASTTAQLQDFDELIKKLIAEGTPLDQTIGRVLRQIRQTLGALPTQQQITLAVRLVGQGRPIDEILGILGVGRGTEAIRARGLPVQPSFEQQAEEAFRASLALVAEERKRLGVLREINQTRKQELSTAQEQLAAARDAVVAAQDQQQAARRALADARQAAREAKQSVLDTIAAGRQAVTDAVTEAKSNLDSLGQTIAQALGQAGATIAGSLSAEQFNRIKERIRAGAGGPDTQQVRQQLQSEIQGGAAQAAPDLTRKFADLTNAFNTGKLTLPQFTRQFNLLLKDLDIKKFRSQFGTAAADLLLDAINKARAQARLIAEGPQRAGGAGRARLVDPLVAVKAAADDVAASQRRLTRSLRDIGDAQRDLQRSNVALRKAQVAVQEAQAVETRANTRATRANTRAQLQLQAVLRAIARKDTAKPKPKAKNTAGQEAGDINLVGANSP